MVAPIDAKASFDVDGETITLRLNFRSLSLAEKEGVNLLSADITALTLTETAILVKALTIQEHPEFTEDHALALVLAEPEAMAKAIFELMSSFGGKKDAPAGNARRRKVAANN